MSQSVYTSLQTLHLKVEELQVYFLALGKTQTKNIFHILIKAYQKPSFKKTLKILAFLFD